jgi:hypothetical protein
MQTISKEKQIANQTLKIKYMSRSINTLSQILLNGSKKVAFIVALFITVGVSSSFAAPTHEGNDAIVTSFHKDFKRAELMGMDVKKDYTKVTFQLNNVVLFAFYSSHGELLAVVRNIVSTKLQIQLLLDLKQKYNDFWINDLFEMSSNGETNYYVTLQNADTKTTLRSSSTSGDWETYRP